MFGIDRHRRRNHNQWGRQRCSGGGVHEKAGLTREPCYVKSGGAAWALRTQSVSRRTIGLSRTCYGGSKTRNVVRGREWPRKLTAASGGWALKHNLSWRWQWSVKQSWLLMVVINYCIRDWRSLSPRYGGRDWSIFQEVPLAFNLSRILLRYIQCIYLGKPCARFCSSSGHYSTWGL